MWEKIEKIMMRQSIKPTGKEFMRITGISTVTTGKMKKNQRNIKLETLDVVAKKLNTTVVEILSE